MEEEGSQSAVVASEPAAKIDTRFVLIHGVCHGAWCWYKLRYLMEKAGYKVTCLDLKSAGINSAPASSILSFDDYNSPLVEFLAALPDGEQVILVGHSAGGLSLSHAIHLFGKKKIKLAIFVAATMLRSGFLSEDDSKIGAPDLSEFGEFNEVYDVEYGPEGGPVPVTCFVNPKFQRQVFYALSPPEDVTLAGMLLRPAPFLPLSGARFAEGEDADEVPRVYVKTTKDKALKAEQQEAMVEKWAPAAVYTLETDHSPFFSSPVALFDLLVKAATSYAT